MHVGPVGFMDDITGLDKLMGIGGIYTSMSLFCSKAGSPWSH